MVLHHDADEEEELTGSTGVEIQVVLHPRIRSLVQCLRSTGVEIQVVLHRNICKYQ